MDNNLFEELDELLKESQDVELNTFENTPDGIYDAYVQSAGFGVTKDKEEPKFTFEFVITGPTHDNKHEWKTYVLNKPENLKRLTTDLNKFGVKTSSMKEIQDQLEDILDVCVEIEIKTGKSGYRNISVEI